MSRIIAETKKDAVLQSLVKCIHQGYIPKSKKSLEPYRNVFHELAISDEDLMLRNDRIILPQSLWSKAIVKAHQGSHPGMSSLKRRIRSHFWFPSINTLVQEAVEQCETCQLFTKKTTKEPISPQNVPTGPWEDVFIDLFGPMPDHRHVLVVLDNYSRFPAAKIVPTTATKPVLKALEDIYTDLGTPERHRTDNGPPFNSAEFAKFSSKNDITHVLTYPYHPQGNPAETFMKPLGKAMKSAFHEHKSRDTALNQLLASYRATPHPATNLSPGGTMFHNGYRKDFQRTRYTTEERQTAQDRDLQQRKQRKELTNISPRRQPSTVQQGDLVLVINSTRSTKFEPVYHRTPYWICEIDTKGVVLKRSTDFKRIRRHKDDIKAYHESTKELVTPVPSDLPKKSTTWIFDRNEEPEHRHDEHTGSNNDELITEDGSDTDTITDDDTIAYEGDTSDAEPEEKMTTAKRRER